MFCPNCGKELPNSAKFCAHCGTSISDRDQQNPDQATTHDHATPKSDSSETVKVGGMQKSVILPQKKSKNTKVLIGLAVALVLVVGAVFAIRLFNERTMIQEIPYAIYEGEAHDKVEAYYADYFGENLMLGFSVEDFSITRGTDSNSFNFTGKLEATDLSQESRPTYNAYISGTITTNFFRTTWSAKWNLQYEIPEDKNVISIQTLCQAYNSNAALADNTYANQYLNVSGTITKIRNTYSNTVEVELGIPTELFYASFEFNSDDTALYNLQVGNQVTLTGFLESGGSNYTLYFLNASLYQRNAPNSGANTPSSPVDYPPTLPPIDPNDPNADIYSRYFGLYVNQEGYALEVGIGTDMYGSYYARIYQSLSDARNYAEPLLEVSGGAEEIGSQGFGIAFSDGAGDIYLYREDDLDKDNLTFDLSFSDAYYGGLNVSGYFQSVYYMVERM